MLEFLLKHLVPTLKTCIKDDLGFGFFYLPFDSTKTNSRIRKTRINFPAVHKWFYNSVTKIGIKKHQSFVWWPLVPAVNWNRKRNKTCSLVFLSTCRNLAETKLFTKELLRYLNQSDCKLIMELLKHYMDDDFIF